MYKVLRNVMTRFTAKVCTFVPAPDSSLLQGLYMHVLDLYYFSQTVRSALTALMLKLNLNAIRSLHAWISIDSKDRNKR